jgi:hypothetical protein
MRRTKADLDAFVVVAVTNFQNEPITSVGYLFFEKNLLHFPRVIHETQFGGNVLCCDRCRMSHPSALLARHHDTYLQRKIRCAIEQGIEGGICFYQTASVGKAFGALIGICFLNPTAINGSSSRRTYERLPFLECRLNKCALSIPLLKDATSFGVGECGRPIAVKNLETGTRFLPYSCKSSTSRQKKEAWIHCREDR